MVTLIRPELSRNNKYWIGKHRYYELKHFCLQYPVWKGIYASLDDSAIPMSRIENMPRSNVFGDPTGTRAMMKTYYREKIELIEKTAQESDKYLYEYILKAVTEGLSYTYLRTRLNIPCGRDMYYDRYRKFFWLLNNARD